MTVDPTELAAIRECLSRLGFAFTGLLGHDHDPTGTALRLAELAGIAREVGDLCDHRARRLARSEPP